MVTSNGLIVRGLTKRFGAGDAAHLAVADVSFEVGAGEFFTMLGPSGCGKTTTLRMIAGLETPSFGEIVLDDADYARVPARQRNIGMVFQSYALFPHLTVFENVAYGLRVRRVNERELSRRVTETLALVGLAALAQRRPAELSGGQQQRVSLARALVYEPRLLLLDEPLANLDAKLRVQMREEIRRVQRALGIMVLYVTHDQEEAMSVSDRIAVFDHGRLIQVDRPAETYARPNSIFVADFIGKANFIPATLERGDVLLPQGQRTRAGRTVTDTAATGELLMVRPELLRPSSGAEGLEAGIRRVEHLGSTIRYTAEVPGVETPLTMDLRRPAAGLAEGSRCRITFDAGDSTLFVRGHRP